MTSMEQGDSLHVINLPSPCDENTLSFYDMIRKRCTIRNIASTKLTMSLLSNLLWAAFGVNRKLGPNGLPGRVAASASNSQEIDIYIALEDGIYLYDALENNLTPVVSGDMRNYAINPRQGFKSKAPVQLIYVADIHRLAHTRGHQEPGLHDIEIQKSYYYIDTGMIAANVSIFSAAHGLASWFHNCDIDMLSKCIGLRPEQKVLFAQTVGWPDHNHSQE